VGAEGEGKMESNVGGMLLWGWRGWREEAYPLSWGCGEERKRCGGDETKMERPEER